MKRIFLLILLIANTLLMSAQVSVEAEIDSIQIFVGQQTHLKLTTNVKPSAKVEFPQFQPTQMITPGVEVLDSKGYRRTRSKYRPSNGPRNRRRHPASAPYTPTPQHQE